MKKSFKVLLIVGIIVSSSVFFNNGYSDSGGADAGLAGGPSDSKCTACHSGSLIKPETGWIISDIDTSGYIPGNTYTITATMINNKSSVSGFQISPQGAAAKALGTVTLINATKTLVRTGVSSRKYVTHTKTGDKDTTWSFKWTAPVIGSGTVTFYGMFNETNGNGSSAGDVIHSSKLIVKENTTVGLTDLNKSDEYIVAYPIPAVNTVNFLLGNTNEKVASVNVYTVNGQLERSTDVALLDNSLKLDISELQSGVHIVSIKVGAKLLQKKIVVE